MKFEQSFASSDDDKGTRETPISQVVEQEGFKEAQDETLSRRDFLKFLGGCLVYGLTPQPLKALERLAGKDSKTETIETIQNGRERNEFLSDLKLMTRFGTYLETVQKDDLDELLSQYSNSFNHNNLKRAAKETAADKYVFLALKDFLKNKGEFEAWPKGGHYDPEHKLISVGAGDVGRAGQTMYHELLHYIFDKVNYLPYEVNDSGGADHFIIDPLVQRFLIMRLIHQGKAPIQDDIGPGWPVGNALNDKVHLLVENNDAQGLSHLMQSEYSQEYLDKSMVRSLSHNESAQNFRSFSITLSNGVHLRFQEDYRQTDSYTTKLTDYGDSGLYLDIKCKDIRDLPIDEILMLKDVPQSDQEEIKKFIIDYQNNLDKDRGYLLTGSQVDEVRYLYTYNISLMQQSLRLAIHLSQDLKQPLSEVFSHHKYQSTFHDFMQEFIKKLESQKDSSPESIGNEVMDKILQK